MTARESYLAALSPANLAEYERIRAIVQRVVPGVEDGFSYAMPAFVCNGKAILWVGIFKRHMSLFPGAVKFTPDAPLEEETIVEVVRQRMVELELPA